MRTAYAIALIICIAMTICSLIDDNLQGIVTFALLGVIVAIEMSRPRGGDIRPRKWDAYKR
jgi:hypothetical protein